MDDFFSLKGDASDKFLFKSEYQALSQYLITDVSGLVCEYMVPTGKEQLREFIQLKVVESRKRDKCLLDYLMSQLKDMKPSQIDEFMPELFELHKPFTHDTVSIDRPNGLVKISVKSGINLYLMRHLKKLFHSPIYRNQDEDTNQSHYILEPDARLPGWL